MTKVFIVDDHALFRLGLKGALSQQYPDITIAGEADSGAELFRLLEKDSEVDIILLDILLPGMSGIEIARRLRQDYPSIKILAISSDNSDETIKAMLDVEVDGFISKCKSSGNELMQAIRSIMDGYEYFGQDIAAIIYSIYISKNRQKELSDELTRREREIIALCRDGLICKEIASRLNISPRTVDTHKSNIFRKVGINSTLEMVQYALRQGIITLE